jgi:Na+/phosphate symporter
MNGFEIVAGVVAGLVLFPYGVTRPARGAAGGALPPPLQRRDGGVARQIANAHLLFNIAGVALVVGFLPWIAQGLLRLVPDGAEGEKPHAAPSGLPLPVSA